MNLAGHLNLKRTFETSCSPASFLSQYDGVYTVLKTKRNELIQYESHFERVYQNAKEYLAQKPTKWTKVPQKESLCQELHDFVVFLLKRYLSTCSPSPCFCSASILIYASQKDSAQPWTVLCLISSVSTTLKHTEVGMAQLPLPISLGMFGSPRHSPHIKQSKWILERQYIQTKKEAWAEIMGTPISDMLLIDSQSRLYEGLTSNFFVLVSNPLGSGAHESCHLQIVTAGAKYVLNGVMRQSIQKASRMLHIPFIQDFPIAQMTSATSSLLEKDSLYDMTHWKGAFISNAMKGLVPVNQIVVQDPITEYDHLFE